MRLLVDEDSAAKTLVRLLHDAGHDVLTADEAGLTSMADAEVLSRAVDDGRVLLTRNCGDFLALSTRVHGHPGILAVYQDADCSRDMGYADIVRAIGNLERAGVSLDEAFIVLNAWRW